MGRWNARLKRSTSTSPYQPNRRPMKRRRNLLATPIRRRLLYWRGRWPEAEALTPRLLTLIKQFKDIVPGEQRVLRRAEENQVLETWVDKIAQKRKAQGITYQNWSEILHDLECSFCYCRIDATAEIPRGSGYRSCYDIAHILSRTHGGPATLDNLLPCCLNCNLQANDKHMIEHMLDQNLPCLAEFEAEMPEEVDKYRYLIKETQRAKQKLGKILLLGSIGLRTHDLLSQALTAPYELRLQIIQEIDKL